MAYVAAGARHCLTVSGTSDRFGTPAGSDWLAAGSGDGGHYRVPAALVRLRRATSVLQRAIPATLVPGGPGFQKVKEVAAGGN